MKGHREDYIRRLRYTPYSILRRLLADILLFALFVGIGLMINSLAA
ncbi:hypothetical protein FHT91_005492 [Rhizobium sp. BK347]|nr:hypothetical protein [Rhizobium sp. BK252]MBB3405206.1 hypothetical protein [Rhizobium sp. BK289]MBB3417803.1 hypothetical protein [Rhizobium sp. BK284]MBB3485682.1 hypothetical protein [Rhizobium sp. BK347]